MRFGKRTMFLALNGSIAFLLLVYSCIWMLGRTTTGIITTPYAVTTIQVSYSVEGVGYFKNYLRNDLDYGSREVSIRYLPFDPAFSRINSFMGILAEPLGWWMIFFIASAMLLFIDNPVFSKGTMFQLQWRFPWISMDEYFPLPKNDEQSTEGYEPGKRAKRKKTHALDR
jgi:hypothetical protein